MTRRIVALVVAPLVLAGLAFWGSAAGASDAYATSFVSKANAERGSRGLKPYAVSSDLSAVARRHAERMAAKKSLYHNPNLGSEVSGWQVVGENVGMGGTVESIHQALMDSPEHRANILARDYTQIGVGTVKDADGLIWVTQVFRLPMTAAAPAPTRPRVVVAERTTATYGPAKRPVARKPVVVKRAPAVAAVRLPAAPVAVESSALLGAFAEATSSNAFGQALAYAGTMAALGR